MVNATDTNLDTFRQHGHKLLLYHGWSDWLVAPGETIRYYDAVMQRESAAGTSMGPLEDAVRLFMVPGMSHCDGGPGATHFDALSAVVDWVESGNAPERIIAGKEASGTGGDGSLQRPLCPYPRTAQYKGAGNPSDAGSFICTQATSLPR